jgi:hypothetical protein
MRNKFEFKPISKTFSDPVTARFKPGAPFGREFSRCDIVLLHPEISTSKTYLNSTVLRDAMLASKDYLEEALGITITDARACPDSFEEEKTDIEVKPKKTSRKKSSEEIIPEDEKTIDEVKTDIPEEASKDIESSLILEEEPLNIKE